MDLSSQVEKHRWLSMVLVLLISLLLIGLSFLVFGDVSYPQGSDPDPRGSFEQLPFGDLP